MDEQEFERDEQLLEARRLKRLEDRRRRRKMQQRIVLGLLLVILILSLVLIVRSCSARKGAGAEDGRRRIASRCIAGGCPDRAGHDRHDCGRGRYHDV